MPTNDYCLKASVNTAAIETTANTNGSVIDTGVGACYDSSTSCKAS